MQYCSVQHNTEQWPYTKQKDGGVERAMTMIVRKGYSLCLLWCSTVLYIFCFAAAAVVVVAVSGICWRQPFVCVEVRRNLIGRNWQGAALAGSFANSKGHRPTTEGRRVVLAGSHALMKRGSLPRKATASQQ